MEEIFSFEFHPTLFPACYITIRAVSSARPESIYAHILRRSLPSFASLMHNKQARDCMPRVGTDVTQSSHSYRTHICVRHPLFDLQITLCTLPPSRVLKSTNRLLFQKHSEQLWCSNVNITLNNDESRELSSLQMHSWTHIDTGDVNSN
jgi:hypothetical protein